MYWARRQAFSNTLNSPRYSMSSESNSNSPLSRTLSPLSFRNQAKISELNQIDTFKKNNKLRLNKEQHQKINYALNIQLVSREGLNKRIKENRLILDYKRNDLNPPIKSNKNEELSRHQQEDRVGRKQTLMEALSQIRGHDNIQKIKSSAKKMVSHAKNYLKDRQKKEELHHINKYRDKFKQVKTVSKQSVTNQRQTVKKNQIEELEDLQRRKDQNYFRNRLQEMKINIFNVCTNPNSKQLQSCPQILASHHFSLDAMIKTNKNTSVNPFRDFSTFSRKMAMGLYDKINSNYKINASDVAINSDDLQFRDMIMLADGKVSPNIADELLGQDELIDKKANQGSQATEHSQVFYRDGHLNNQVDFHAAHFEASELEDFRNFPLSKKQIEQDRLSKMFLEKMKTVLIAQSKAIQERIMDGDLHKGFLKEKEKILLQQMQSDHLRGFIDHGEIQRKIRYNKTRKDKRQSIKVQVMAQTMKEKKELEKEFKMIKTMNAKEAKSKSKSSKVRSVNKQRSASPSPSPRNISPRHKRLMTLFR